jgi:acyl carrier protein phosphodiesterase
MNFLAHLYLSGDDKKVMVGNFIGDFVKGRTLSAQFEPDVVKGIALHRAIDEFTDNHAVVRKSKLRLRPTYRHYAPVIVDVFYDHFLAKYWHLHHEQALPDYARQVYHILGSFQSILPDETNRMLPYMINGNWLVNYGKLEGIQRALGGMSRRSKFNPKMDESVADLEANYPDFKNEFDEFFPTLKNFSADFLASF